MHFFDLQEQRRKISDRLNQRIQNVLNHTQFILGPEVQELEEKLAAFVRVKHCVSVANGTDALQIALMALDIGPGDEVITTPFSFMATAESILLLGAKPIFVDIDERTYNIKASEIEAKINSKTKAILPVSLFGQLPEIDQILEISKRLKIPVVEDAAQSFGATSKGRRSCSWATISCTSFFPSKPLGCYGDGGACFTNDDEIAKRIRQIRTHGQERRYQHSILGVNSRLDTLQAAILLAKLEIFEEECRARQKVAKAYDHRLHKVGLEPPFIADGNTSVYAQYTIQITQREYCLNFLKEKNIPTAVHYPLPLHHQPVVKQFCSEDEKFLNSEKLSTQVLSLPMHPYLTEGDQDLVIGALVEARSSAQTR